jgi:hypothetical protein
VRRDLAAPKVAPGADPAARHGRAAVLVAADSGVAGGSEEADSVAVADSGVAAAGVADRTWAERAGVADRAGVASSADGARGRG